MTGLVGAVLHRRLVERFGDARAALRAGVSELRRVQGVGEITAAAIANVARSGDAGREIEKARRSGIRIAAHGAPEYPAALLSLHDPPLVLYLKGDLLERDHLSLGVVGSRRCTPYGERQAARFAADLAELGVTVVSGLARGIDTRAHQGALRARNGRTLAVMGSGLSRVYPPENAKLFAAVSERGAAISEFPLDAGPQPENFPRRNRLISGLSLGILIVEAAEKSGALITADWAAEQGREVFCLPGSVESPMSRGAHLLIKQGAKLVENAMDVLEELPALAPLLRSADAGAWISPLERTVLAKIDRVPRSCESVAAATKLPECSVGAALQRLAARGLVLEEGGAYRKTAPDGRPT
ncbi:MAG: DNA-protecting protein DprA [Planctomycetes bacterium]|nr:DNA-protecting protein DprA [Planctomycetota bacterium]